jgi:hypothetical protein
MILDVPLVVTAPILEHTHRETIHDRACRAAPDVWRVAVMKSLGSYRFCDRPDRHVHPRKCDVKQMAATLAGDLCKRNFSNVNAYLSSRSKLPIARHRVFVEPIRRHIDPGDDVTIRRVHNIVSLSASGPASQRTAEKSQIRWPISPLLPFCARLLLVDADTIAFQFAVRHSSVRHASACAFDVGLRAVPESKEAAIRHLGRGVPLPVLQ